MKPIAVFTLLMASAAFAAAQESAPAAPPATPAVDDVLARFVQAVGGRAALEKLTTTTQKGTFEVPDFGASGPCEVDAKSGDKTLTTIEISGYGTVRRGYDGSAGWSDDPQGGLRDLAGDELADMRRSAAWNSPLRMKDLYPGLAVKGSDKVKGRDAWVLEGAINDMKHRLYFDAGTGLLVRADQEVKTPDGKGTAVTYLEDYKPVDGVQEAFTITFSSPQLNWNMKLAEIKHNDPIDDAKFAKPAGDASKPAEAAPKPADTPAKQ